MIRKLLVAVMVLACALALAQTPKTTPGPKTPATAPAAGHQTPRQALLEMLLATDDATAEKHLMDATLQTLQKVSDEKNPMAKVNIATMALERQGLLKTFETGPLLMTVIDPNKGDKIDITVTREETQADRAELELGFRMYPKGQAQATELIPDVPIIPKLLVTMKNQGGIWKIAELGVSARVPLDDPAFLDAVAKNMEKSRNAAVEAGAIGNMRTLNTSEINYSMQFPEAGFACTLAVLGGEDGGDGTAEHAGLIDSALASGEKSGYKYHITNCTGKPAMTYTVIAEPVKPGLRAFCTDESAVVYFSKDGSGATCLANKEPVQ